MGSQLQLFFCRVVPVVVTKILGAQSTMGVCSAIDPLHLVGGTIQPSGHYLGAQSLILSAPSMGDNSSWASELNCWGSNLSLASCSRQLANSYRPNWGHNRALALRSPTGPLTTRTGEGAQSVVGVSLVNWPIDITRTGGTIGHWRHARQLAH